MSISVIRILKIKIKILGPAIKKIGNNFQSKNILQSHFSLFVNKLINTLKYFQLSYKFRSYIQTNNKQISIRWKEILSKLKVSIITKYFRSELIVSRMQLGTSSSECSSSKSTSERGKIVAQFPHDRLFSMKFNARSILQHAEDTLDFDLSCDASAWHAMLLRKAVSLKQTRDMRHVSRINCWKSQSTLCVLLWKKQTNFSAHLSVK